MLKLALKIEQISVVLYLLLMIQFYIPWEVGYDENLK